MEKGEMQEAYLIISGIGQGFNFYLTLYWR